MPRGHSRALTARALPMGCSIPSQSLRTELCPQALRTTFYLLKPNTQILQQESSVIIQLGNKSPELQFYTAIFLKPHFKFFIQQLLFRRSKHPSPFSHQRYFVISSKGLAFSLPRILESEKLVNSRFRWKRIQR